jgi:polyhydroxybutyrate depolymerase
MTRRQILVVLLGSLVAGACSGSPSSSTAPASAALTPGSTPSATSSASASPAGALVVGGDRPVTVHVPSSYDPSRPAPLLIALHGYTSSGDEIDRWFGLADPAQRAGFVYATPDGTKDGNGNRFWNATDACCNFSGSTVDDVAYLSGVIAEIQGKLAIDPKRIAFVGHSNGGFMSYRMACDRADLVAAIVSVAGETFADAADCKPSAPVSVAQVQGTADEVINFNGGGPVTSGTGPYPGAHASASSWAKNDGCAATAKTLGTKVDVDADLADGTDPAETTVQEWQGCEAGSTVQLWTIPNGHHGPSVTPAFADAVIQFLVDHPKR